MPQLWAGIDAGKTHHHCVVIDDGGARLFSQRVANDETDLLDLMGNVAVLSGGGEAVWAVDLNHGGAALLIALLAAHDQQLLYIPGRTVHHASRTYRGDGKTDAKDAAVIADQARMRRDLQPVRTGDDISVDLRILTARRTDKACDRTRAINRLRAQLLEYFPALEHAFDYSRSKAGLVLLTRYQTPDALRRLGQKRLHTWLKNQGTRSSADVAERAITAAKSQYTTVAVQRIGALMVAELAQEVLDIQNQLDALDTLIAERFREHHQAEIMLSMPGFGPLLGAEFFGAIGGDLAVFDSVDRLAGVAGLAPAPKDSGRIRGNHHRPRRYDRRLLRACYMAAMSSLRSSTASRTYYDRKRAEGKTHVQSVLSLARRRLNVLWAMLRDGTAYKPPGDLVASPA
ncbi:IS110 family transposase [Arthrobacter sp. CAN_A212]|uniref:IS110 family transposase n=1 Tax=Arthrobacter sp. CAN_A212 TaxID=2787719 RepID=UPI003FA46360